MAVVAVFILSYARKFPSITTVVIRQLALSSSVTYLLAYLSITCHWRVKHLNIVLVTSLRGALHVDYSSTLLKQN